MAQGHISLSVSSGERAELAVLFIRHLIESTVVKI
jgi:hypothetical protein